MPSLTSTLARRMGFDPGAWLRDTRLMRARVAAYPAPAPRNDALRFAIVMAPWMGTSVPWFSLVCGLFLAARGNRISFIVDDLPFGSHGLRFRFVVACMRSVLRRLRGHHEVIRLGAQRSDSALSEAERDAVCRLAELNAVWALRGEMSESGRAAHLERSVRQLGASHGAIGRVLQGGRFDVVFVPGGVWGSTGLWTSHARARGIRLASYDSGGYGTLMLAADGVACQLQDIPRAFAMLKARPDWGQEHAAVVAAAQAEIGRRRGGVDKFASQMQGSRQRDPRFDGAVLIALNSSWDSAALGLHVVFDDSMQWIVETVRYLLEHTDAPVIVRQHPAERLEIARTSDDYHDLLARHVGSQPRLHFIAADEPVNSYDLLEQVAAVVVYTSTIGIEAAAHGKPVVTASRSYYADLGFVWKAGDLQQYRALLSQAASGGCVVTPAMRDDALCCYYLTQCCNWVFSPFNPEGFSDWSRQDLADLARHVKVQATITSLERNVPVAFLNHLAQIESKEMV
ncbi:MAG: hypothetical protein ABIO45_00690 [Burkholderiaceae bacterium]